MFIFILQYYLHIFEVLVVNFIITSNPIFNARNILQYLHLDTRSNLVHTFHGIVIRISYYDCVQPEDGFYSRNMLLMKT